MFALGIRYLTGYSTATDVACRTSAEWPPHPGRIFMAMAAAHFESADDPASTPTRAALLWLEEQPPPSLACSEADRRDVLETYVPPNDVPGGKREVIPAYRNNRQPRTFPKVRPHDDTVHLIWPDADATADGHAAALKKISANVIRIGHSSSLVQMWPIFDAEVPAATHIPSPPSDPRPGPNLRLAGSGTLEYLEHQFNGDAIRQFHRLSEQIAASGGTAQRELKAEFETAFGTPWRASLKPPEPRYPTLSLAQKYVISAPDPPTAQGSVFDPELLVFAKKEGPVLGLESTWQLLTALRGTIESRCAPTPEWISGHAPGGAPSQSPHLALLPLAFVGDQYADGHLLGVALAFPRAIPPTDRGRALRNLLYAPDGTPAEITLTLGKLGVWTVELEERPSPPRALQPEEWCVPCDTWASVSPVVLNRHPKKDPNKDPDGWSAEVAATIAAACRHIGLPEPSKIDIDTTSWHRGAPAARPGPGGFPLMPARPGGPNRRQFHALIRFPEPVAGPVILGAGRYRGYGLFKPFYSRKSDPGSRRP